MAAFKEGLRMVLGDAVGVDRAGLLELDFAGLEFAALVCLEAPLTLGDGAMLARFRPGRVGARAAVMTISIGFANVAQRVTCKVSGERHVAQSRCLRAAFGRVFRHIQICCPASVGNPAVMAFQL